MKAASQIAQEPLDGLEVIQGCAQNGRPTPIRNPPRSGGKPRWVERTEVTDAVRAMGGRWMCGAGRSSVSGGGGVVGEIAEVAMVSSSRWRQLGWGCVVVTVLCGFALVAVGHLRAGGLVLVGAMGLEGWILRCRGRVHRGSLAGGGSRAVE